ncbi:hypothetical protein ACFXKD_03685 [Nocardiopsis aegyptia]|uniref:hypothetical protein n=1 Tax=Nocardiopsis aegyptia TaxID=220378 RepID=UPI0036719266
MAIQTGQDAFVPHARSSAEESAAQGVIPDLSQASMQSSFIDTRPEKPEATSTLYIRRFSTKTSAGPEDHTVVGVHVVLEEGHPNGLWNDLHIDRSKEKIDDSRSRPAVGSLRIYCDTLEVRGAFSLPEANVEVFARHLVWANDVASINTSPLPWRLGKARNAANGNPGENGAEGRNAGSLRIFVDKVTSVGNPDFRLIAQGGRGQDPGAGEDGKPGTSLQNMFNSQFICKSWTGNSHAWVNFDPRVVHYEAKWECAGLTVATENWGVKSFPGNGSNALTPGIPGNGGDGGALTTNLHSHALPISNKGGEAGTRERDYKGGSAGFPENSAHYKITLWKEIGGTKSASFKLVKTDSNVAKAGTNAPGRPASRGAGSTPTPVFVDIPNSWLHPLGVQATLEYARDLFLAGAREELQALLPVYDKALALPIPATKAWDGVPPSVWAAAQTEITTMLVRHRAHLDYFGNPAGITPLLSLSGSIKLYEEETERALRMMLLSAWVTDADRGAKEAASIIGDTIDTVNSDSKAAAEQVTAGEAKISEVKDLIGTVESDLEDLATRLNNLRAKLLSEAQDDLNRQATIKFDIKMACALCQVIPVGQPALGAVGSLAAVSTGLMDKDLDAVPDTLSKIGGALTTVTDAVEQAKEARKAASEKKSVDWGAVGKGLQGTFSLASEGVQALQVPKTEVEAALARLEADSPEWNDLTRRIREVNEKKAALFGDLEKAIDSVGEGFSRLAANSGTIVHLQQRKGKVSTDPEAVFAVQQMDQRARLTLQKYLYLLVKSYESALLKRPSVDWKLARVTKRIAELAKTHRGGDPARLDAGAADLGVLFKANLSQIREQLLGDYDVLHETTGTRWFGLTARQTPQAIDTLNKGESLVIDPLSYGLIRPDLQRARLSGVELTKLVFDREGPPVPEGTDVALKLVPAAKGIMRRGEDLFLLTSESPVRWGWTIDASGGIDPDTQSLASKDVLDFVLGPGSEKVRGKVSLPPAWSDLTLSVLYWPPLKHKDRPRISEVGFKVKIDSSPAPEDQRVLIVLPGGVVGDSVITCPDDLAGRSDGYGPMVRIYKKGRTVELTAPALSGNAVFEGWDTNEDEPDPAVTSLRVRLNDHVRAVPSWARGEVAVRSIMDLPQMMRMMGEQEFAEALAEKVEDEEARRELMALAYAQETAPPTTEPKTRAIRVEPDPKSVAVGFVPPQGEPDVMEHGSGWDLVNYRGVVGWVEST